MNKYNVLISFKAQNDLVECVNFVMRVFNTSAHNLIDDFNNALNSLNTYPERNSTFNMPTHTPFLIRKHIMNNRYVILYSIEDFNVIVYRVIDSRRNFDFLLY